LAGPHNDFRAVIRRDGACFIAYSPDLRGANGQGRTKEDAKEGLAEAIALILEDHRQPAAGSRTRQSRKSRFAGRRSGSKY
jgi:predicted RNase H-like HicB family nuclease